ncbi:hypothetical protein [Prosthecobacter fusiformis]|nr:hypothetical protein [Prosthecobacter fusiformis]
MSELNNFEFAVPIHIDGGTGHVHVFWSCDASQIQRFLKERYDLIGPDRDSWEGVCIAFPELDEKAGCPTALIALRMWEANAEKFALLAHECFHAAEWMLKQSGYKPPTDWMDLPPEGGPRQAWEDAAYLLQWIMRRSLEGILNDAAGFVSSTIKTPVRAGAI